MNTFLIDKQIVKQNGYSTEYNIMACCIVYSDQNNLNKLSMLFLVVNQHRQFTPITQLIVLKMY